MKKKKKLMPLPELLCCNVLFLLLIIGMVMVGNMVKTADIIQKTNVPINVTSIDDVDSEYAGMGSKTYKGRKITTYIYNVNRILHYNYEGQDYDATDTLTFELDRDNFDYELRTNYLDDYAYYIQPGQNSYVAKMPKGLADKSVQDMISLISRIVIIALIVITVILDVTYVIKCRKLKRDGNGLPM